MAVALGPVTDYNGTGVEHDGPQNIQRSKSLAILRILVCSAFLTWLEPFHPGESLIEQQVKRGESFN
ncbi:MAG: hypothetical protein AAFR99_13420 [Cyanobacteria bacterium J06629_9]